MPIRRQENLPSTQDPFSTLINSLFLGPWSGDTGQAAFPPLNVYLDGGGCVIECALPGYRKEDVHITMEHGVLTIRGEVAQNEPRKDNQYLVREIRRQPFQRSVQMPFEPDPAKTRADLKDGILEVTVLPNEKARNRQIHIDVK